MSAADSSKSSRRANVGREQIGARGIGVKTWLVDADVAPHWDEEFIRDLMSTSWPRRPGESLRIGLHDYGGRLYRIVVSECVSEFAWLTAKLQERGHRLKRRCPLGGLDFLAT